VAAAKTSSNSIRARASEARLSGIKERLKVLAPEMKTLAVIRSVACKKGKSRLSIREIDREIRAYRQERQP
jgi:hypothetical protein